MDGFGRKYRGHYEIEHWAGTLDDVRSAFQLAETARTERIGHVPKTELRIVYDDGGTQSLPTVEDITEANIDITKARSIEYGAMWQRDSDDWVSIVFSFNPGVSITVTSLDRVWAFGLAEVVNQNVQPGVLSEKRSEIRPVEWWATLHPWERAAVTLLIGGWAGALLLMALGGISAGQALYPVVFTAVLLALPVRGLLDLRPYNPALTLVAEGTALDGAQRESGFTNRVQEEIRKRPVVNLVLLLAFAVAANKISEHL